MSQWSQFVAHRAASDMAAMGAALADGKLTCRWPTHVITEISGIIARDRFVRSLGMGRCQRKC